MSTICEPRSSTTQFLLKGELMWIRNAILMVGTASIRSGLRARFCPVVSALRRRNDYLGRRGNGDELRHERNTPLICQVLKIATQVPGQRWKEDTPLPW